MGLDQYAYSVKMARVGKKKVEEKEEIAYWRKHNRLQGWMENLWRSKGNKGEFNCVEVEITEEDLDGLEKAINDKDLPETQGFFFGGDSYDGYDEYYKKYDEDFIKAARKAYKNDKQVFYSSWW